MPENPMRFLQPSDMRRLILADAEAEAIEASEREADEQAEREAEQQAATELAEAAGAAFATMEPPGEDSADASPMRARLIRYVAWLSALEHEHTALIEGRTAYLTAQKVPTLTKQAIADLIKQDKSGLVALMAGGGKHISQHTLRGHERKLLAEKLSRDEHAAATATEALIEVEGKIDALAKQIEVVRSREGEFVADALQEHLVATTGARIIAEAEALRVSVLNAQGAAGELARLRGFGHFPRALSLLLPTPRLHGETLISADEDRPAYRSGVAAGYEISFPIHEQQRHQQRWREMSRRLADDPRADLGA
jgi:hypothetical protein